MDNTKTHYLAGKKLESWMTSTKPKRFTNIEDAKTHARIIAARGWRVEITPIKAWEVTVKKDD